MGTEVQEDYELKGIHDTMIGIGDAAVKFS
jgi:hypothetical protein